MSAKVGYWRWLYRHRQWWWQRDLPPLEYDTVIYTGLPGAGKTTYATSRVIRYLRRGVRVASNVYIRDTYTGLETEPVRCWLDVLRLSVESVERDQAIVIYLAEVQQMCDARIWQLTPPWWSELVEMRRHMGLSLILDTQHVDQIEKRLRMLVGQLVQVRPSWLRRHWRRWPRLQTRVIDMRLGDDPRDWSYQDGSDWRTEWLYSWAWHGHAHREMVGATDWEDLATPEALREIESLRQRAMAATKCELLPAWPDDSAELHVDDSTSANAL